EERYAQTAGAADVPSDNAVRIAQAIPPIQRSSQDILGDNHWHTCTNPVGAQPFGLNAQLVLQRDVGLERRHIVWRGQQEQVARLSQADRLAQLLLEAFEHADTLDRQPDVDLGAKLVAHAASALARGALTKDAPLLQHQHVRLPTASKVIGQTGAHHP